MTDDVIERVERGIAKAIREWGGCERLDCLLKCSSDTSEPDRWRCARQTETIRTAALSALRPGDRIGDGLVVMPVEPTVGAKFQMNQRVRKIKGSSWQGVIVGFYSTKLTPIGYCIESEREPGSVQLYPETALEAAPHD